MWDDPYEKAFADLKAYLSTLPFLVSLDPNKKLYLYLAASKDTLTAILVKETPKGQLPLYYVSKALHDSKFNYIRIEKLAYSLQSHYIVILIDQPLREVL